MLKVVPLKFHFTGSRKKDLVTEIKDKLGDSHCFLGIFVGPGGDWTHTWESATGKASNHELLGVMERVKYEILMESVDMEEGII